MLKLSLRSVGLVASLVVAAIVVGCAPAYKDGPANDRMAVLKARSSGLKAFSTDSDGFSCPSDYNVLLKDHIGANGSFDYTGNGSFKVCVGSDTSKFRLTGITTSSTICIYPMIASQGGSIQLAENPQCFGVSGTPVNATFSSKSINYFAIVDVNFTNQMSACLSSSSPCPSHSEGFVQ